MIEKLTTLWQHQEKGVSLATAEDRAYFGLFFEQGCGKTLTAITILRTLFTNYKRGLKTIIFCPAIVVPNWLREFELFSKCAPMVQLLQGKKEQRIKDLAKPDKKIFVTNFEALDMEGLFWVYKDKKKKTKALLDHGFEVMVVDESHRFKNPSAKRTKLAIQLSDKIHYRYLLTGTPIINTPQDIWAQFRILDGGEAFGHSFFVFRNAYFYDANAAMPQGRHFPDWRLKPGVEAEIQAKIYAHAMRVTKAQCLDLPPLLMQELPVGMSSEQKRCYSEMREDFITYLKSGVCVASIALTKALRLAQITSGFLKTEEGECIRFKSVPRMDALEDLLEDYALGNKVIVWSVFKENYEAIAERCEKLGLKSAFLTGEQNAKEKAQAVEDFNQGDVQVLIANPAAGGTGVNLTASSISIWYSRTFSLEQRLQALARNHRGGSERHEKITNIDLVCEESIDRHILNALNGKENVAESILAWKNKV